MPGYRLTSRAVRDLTGILSFLTKEAGPEVALRTEDKVFESFESLAQSPGVGHRRADITPRNVLFHTIRPYIVVYEVVAAGILIHAVLHGARNLPAILKPRL